MSFYSSDIYLFFLLVYVNKNARGNQAIFGIFIFRMFDQSLQPLGNIFFKTLDRKDLVNDLVEELEVIKVGYYILVLYEMFSLLHVNLIKTFNGLLLQLFLIES